MIIQTTTTIGYVLELLKFLKAIAFRKMKRENLGCIFNLHNILIGSNYT